jgi:hypothetical protein
MVTPKPVDLISGETHGHLLFQQAVLDVSTLTGGAVQIDPKADVFVVTANLDRIQTQECKCECGHVGDTCGGGGGGGAKLV